MGDVDREDVRLFVYRRLADPRFRERLTAQVADGTRPILVSVPDDSLESVLHHVQAVGGAANVVVPYLNGILVVTITVGDEDDPSVPRLAPDCTVGLFVARLLMDGDHAAYRFVLENVDHEDAGRAEMVAVGG